MPDKKLTDAEIKKALECCSVNIPACPDCPYYERGHMVECEAALITDSFNLVNRLQAENERWSKNCDELYEQMSQRLKAELKIERRLAKAEAYKECIEKVKENFTEQFCGQKYDLIHSWFNNALKELVGDNIA